MQRTAQLQGTFTERYPGVDKDTLPSVEVVVGSKFNDYVFKHAYLYDQPRLWNAMIAAGLSCLGATSYDILEDTYFVMMEGDTSEQE